MLKNPDKNHILHGISASFAMRSRSPRKSSQTNTTRSLSQNLLFSPDNLVETFRDNLRRSSQAATLQSSSHRQLAPDTMEESLDPSRMARSQSSLHVPCRQDCWYLEPDWHVNAPRRDMSVQHSPLPGAASESRNLSDLHDIYRLTDRINRTRHPQAEKEVSEAARLDSRQTGDLLARCYFPVTLGETAGLSSQLASEAPPPKTPTFSPPSTGLPARDETPWRQETPHNRGTLGNSWRSTSSRIEEEFIMADHAPTISASSVYVTSPYQTELARLRMSRLRLEAELLKEVKRQDELERTRGPQPKWYELKTPQFNYEAHKNTDLLRSSQQWQELYDYHQLLTQRSQQFNTQFMTSSTQPGEYQKERYMT